VHAVEEAAFLAVRMASPRGLPVIYDMQSSLPEQLRKHIVFRVPPLGTFAAAAERWLLRRVDVVVASAGLAERVRLVAPDTQYHEWRFASPLARASADDAAALRRTLGIAPDAPVVLYSGTFESYQGLPELLDAIPMVLAEEPDAVFVLVGANGSDAAEVARRASGAVPVRALRLIQRQPREAMPGYLAMADVLVSPRKHGRNLPLKIFDYLAAERPIVATDIPTHRSILDADRALLVEPTGAALASGIAGVLRDPERARALAAGAQAYARRHLDWMAFVGSVEEIYAEALRRE
jgi:glycosyltransferase involved in cell wall biosynthesis